ncbi:MAG: hypothetical protein EXR95_04500 [Gemmatimonadetes bacterium]|nr:hypothetical protein [Gemmatimonadota bacterium]
MNDPVTALLGSRRERLGQVLGRYLFPTLGVAAPAHVRQHLLEEATGLYWNELEWEHITHDAGDEAIERCFAGLLSFVRGLLLREAAPGSRASGARPEVVEELLRFLAARVLELDDLISKGQVDDEPEKVRRELDMTDRLLDLVLYRWLELSPQEAARAEAVRSVH